MTPLEKIAQAGQKAGLEGAEAARRMTPKQRMEVAMRNYQATRRKVPPPPGPVAND